MNRGDLQLRARNLKAAAYASISTSPYGSLLGSRRWHGLWGVPNVGAVAEQVMRLHTQRPAA